MRTIRIIPLLFILGSLTLFTGCASSPFERTGVSTSDVAGRWEHIADINRDFDSIEFGKTTSEGLETIGLGPNSPNVTRLHYIEVAVSLSDVLPLLPTPIVQCIEARESCVALVVDVERINRRGKENIFESVLLNKKETEITGWRFRGTVFLIDNVAVYTVKSSETPNISSMEKKSDPLHILKSFFMGGIKSLFPF